jgi:hypothetical protein
MDRPLPALAGAQGAAGSGVGDLARQPAADEDEEAFKAKVVKVAWAKGGGAKPKPSDSG